VTQEKQWDLVKDFIAIGSGIGGVTGAIVAHDLGLDTIILEKSSLAGGVTAYSYGELWVPNNHLSAQAGKGDSPEAAKAYMDFLAAGFVEPGYSDIYRAVAPVALKYLEDKANIPFKLIKKFSDYQYPIAPGTLREGRFIEVNPIDAKDLGDFRHKVRVGMVTPYSITHDELFGWGGGAAFVNWDFSVMARRMQADERCLGAGLAAALIRAAVVDRKIDLRLSTPATRLIVDDDGVVVGVVAEHEGNELRIRARHGVLMAVGGYDWNQKLATTFEGRHEIRSMAVPGVDGDNFRLGSDIGAGLYKIPICGAVTYGLRIPGETGDEGQDVWRDVLFCAGYPHTILVNADGHRFGDESFYRSTVAASHDWDVENQKYKNFPAYIIFDQSFNDRYPILTFQPGQPLPENIFARADTLTELAGKLGIDGRGLEATVKRFNGFVAEGIDKDFGRGSKSWSHLMVGDSSRPGNPNLGAVTKPPFYGAKTEALMSGIPAAGLRFDRFARVENMRGNVVPGIYVAGNSAGYMELGAGYQSGFANTRGMLWAYIAAHHAAGIEVTAENAAANSADGG
jgi:3-oxosteroid 1-dehydrogenase